MVEHFNVPRAATARDHVWMQPVGQIHDFLLVRRERCDRGFHIPDIDHLHLSDQDRVGRRRLKSAGQARRARGAREPGDNGRFLYGKGHDVVFAVDEEVERDAQGQAQHADNILDHLVRGLTLERVLASGQCLHIFICQQAAFSQRGDAITDG